MSEVTPTPTATPAHIDVLGVPLSEIVSIIIIAVVAISIERAITRYLSRISKKAGMEPNTANNLALFTRILILLGAIAAFARVVGYDSTWIVSFSAIGAAAVGFASQKTIGNFIAGIFLLAAKPFKVGDYVKVGTVEGIVEEINLKLHNNSNCSKQ